MTVSNEGRQCPVTREELRAYLLGTLNLRRQAEVAAHLDTCASCHDALQEEEKRLSLLDGLAEEQPLSDLAARTMLLIEEEEAQAPRHTSWYSSFVTAVVTVCMVGIIGVVLLPALARSREAARRSSSQNNLKQIGLVLKMYSNESPGDKYPPLAPYEGLWVPDLRVLYPEYLSDMSVLIPPSHPDAPELEKRMEAALAQTPPDWETIHRIAAQSLVYLPYAVQEAEDLPRMVARASEQERLDRDADLELGEGRTAYRVRNGIERFLITDINNPAASASAQSEVHVVFENPNAGIHTPRGINVLYMDGHVEFLRDAPDEALFQAVAETFPVPPLDP